MASTSPLAVLNSISYVPSDLGPKIMMRFLPCVIVPQSNLKLESVQRLLLEPIIL
jgi:hypothetical protein